MTAAELSNDPINADGYIENLLGNGADSLKYEENNTDGSDFFSSDQPASSPVPVDNKLKDMNEPGKNIKDTSKRLPVKPGDKTKAVDPAIKTDDKKQKPKDIPAKANDY